ncbi:CAP domain-containing protein [Hymenobacter taeanensis]|uniref:CAP domain-containing protein n=1 Tax=Hymenobacter taeanensis TaxID=2735321 RepID=A0A6M6BJ08_9BACT|nr:CAP domain-containing protein [Hymenobacter taeanensis]QJX47303.1 CAP domain-containing protein [Hymenobacter taeanensis]
MKFLPLLVLVLFSTLTQASAPALTATRAAWTDVRATSTLLQQLNSYRRRSGLPPLVLSETACRAARLQAAYNLTHHTHGHYHPQYATPRERLMAVGHHFEKASGFVSYGFENCVRFRGMRAKDLRSIEEQILRAYQQSPKHNAALLDPNPTKVGIATLYDGDELQNSIVFCI